MISGSLLGSIAVGAAIGMASSAGVTAIKGGRFKDILKSGLIGGGLGAAGGAVGGAFSGAAGGALSNAGTAITKIGAEGSKLATVTGKVGQGLINIGSKISGNPATTTATNITAEQPDAATIASAANDPILPNGPNLHPKIGADTKVTTKALTQSNTTAVAPTAGGSTTTGTVSAPVPENAAATNTATTATPASASAPKTILNKIGTGIKNNAGKVGGQVAVQGLLSLASAGMAAKSAKEANKVSQQSLLFQQQTYRDQRADQQRKESQLKSDAWNAYQSANILGEKLYNQGTNSLLFTKDFKTNPTGGYNVLSGNSPSFLDSELSLTKYTDLT